MPDDQQKPQGSASGGTIAACIAAACLIAAPLAARWEGYAPTEYKDPANIKTWCYGETMVRLSKDPSYIYSKDQCMTLLRQRMARDYAPKLAQCLPEIVPNRFIFGALIDASYNAGPIAVCNGFGPLIHKHQLTAACRKLPTWYITATRRVNGKRVGQPFILKGLVNRRKDEMGVCLQGV